MSIKILDQGTISRIAAGEVVERPASVVKELVENSLDAASSQISIEIKGDGVNLIQVTDNGHGIPADEMESAFQRYATSKITSFDDLESTSSLGFRGEALPSIAAVSQVDVISCPAGESTGNYISIKESTITNCGSKGHSPGTTITVRNLFRNVPARLKFLKSPTTENGHIANVVSQYALAFPEVKFTLTNDGKTISSTPGSGKLIDSIAQVYGMDVAGNMLEINNSDPEWQDESENSSVTVNGMVSSPSINRSNRGYLSLFVNRRWISSRLLAWAMDEAYHGLLMQGKHPIAIINISIPPKYVDANIHPTKTEVKFQNERLIFRAVQKAVRQALLELTPVPRIEEVATDYKGTLSPTQPLWTSTRTSQISPDSSATTQSTPIMSLPALRLLGQLDSSYIIAEGPDGLHLIDQHAAHERIQFEKINHQISRKEIEIQGMLEPATLEVSIKQDVILKAQYERLAEFGFTIEPFGERTYLVRAIPALLHKKDWREVLGELLDDTPQGGNNDWLEKIAISIACHSAIRAGQTLSDDEMRELLRQLEQTAIPNTCPHGRPTMIQLNMKQLEKEFGRS
ncbi:DNA mismatch repair endonuclease MutL [Chloroflexota bacterium]